MHAEQVYLFRHALLRDAAHELMLPGYRAALHLLAAEVMELIGAHNLPAVAAEIAMHLRASGDATERERKFALMGAQHAATIWDHDSVIRLYGRLTEIGDVSEVARSLQVLASWHARFRADKPAARQYLRKLLRLARQTSNPALAAQALQMISTLSPAGTKLALKRMAFKMASRAKAWLPAGLALGNMGMHYCRIGQPRRGARILARAIMLHRRANNPAGIGYYLSQLAGAMSDLGRNEQALAYARDAVKVLLASELKVYLPNGLNALAQISSKAGAIQEALSALSQSRLVFQEMGLMPEAARTDLQIALLELRNNQPGQARRTWQSGMKALAGSTTDVPGAVESEMLKACVSAGIAPLNQGMS